jgi:hypothetical protein
MRAHGRIEIVLSQNVNDLQVSRVARRRSR